jgi:hydroxymethylbilane synthase
MRKVSIATRSSRLALWQAGYIKSLLQHRHPDLGVDLITVKTKGDIILDVPLAKIGGKGLFVKEIEDVLLDGRADFAVHSMKDLPMVLPAGLLLGVIPERECSADFLLSCTYASLAELPALARIGTSSLRRTAQLLAVRPDFHIQGLRGNIETRLRKLNEGHFDAIVLAGAGLKRLGLSAPYQNELPLQSFLPAPGQGALGLEYSEQRQDVFELLGFLDHYPTRLCINAERSFSATLGGSCQTPIGALALLDQNKDEGDLLTLNGLVSDLTGQKIIRKSISSPVKSPEQASKLGIDLALQILDAGAAEILSELTIL